METERGRRLDRIMRRMSNSTEWFIRERRGALQSVTEEQSQLAGEQLAYEFQGI